MRADNAWKHALADTTSVCTKGSLLLAPPCAAVQVLSADIHHQTRCQSMRCERLTWNQTFTVKAPDVA